MATFDNDSLADVLGSSRLAAGLEPVNSTDEWVDCEVHADVLGWSPLAAGSEPKVTTNEWPAWQCYRLRPSSFFSLSLIHEILSCFPGVLILSYFWSSFPGPTGFMERVSHLVTVLRTSVCSVSTFLESRASKVPFPVSYRWLSHQGSSWPTGSGSHVVTVLGTSLCSAPVETDPLSEQHIFESLQSKLSNIRSSHS